MEEEFFEEDLTLDEQVNREGGKKPNKKGKKKRGKVETKKKPVQAKARSGGKAAPVAVDLTWVVVAVICAFVLGFVTRGFFIQTTPTATSTMQGTSGGQSAPPLTQEQLQKGMPKGHPSIEGMGGTGTSTSTPTSTAPAKQP